MERLQELCRQREEKCTLVAGIFDEAGDDALPKEKRDVVISTNKEIDDIEHEIKELKEKDELRALNAQRIKDINTAVMPVPFSGEPVSVRMDANGAKAGETQTVGETFLNNPDVKAWMARVAPAGSTPTKAAFGHSPNVSIEGKALVTGLSSTSAGAMVVNQRLPIVDTGTFARPLTIRDLITVGETNSDTVDYVRQGTHTNAAAPVAEATATSGASGTKPESALVLSLVSETVKTIAHWIPATRRALADAPQIRTLIDSFLRYGLEEELEDQIINGDGTGENFLGVLNTPGTTAQAWDTNLLTTTRKARTKVRITGRAQATAYLLHPEEWQSLDLLQDNEARYYFGGPSVLGTPRLWGLPVVECEAPGLQGAGVVADWRLAVLWDRMQTDILISDSHSDFFIRNLIAILGEMRAAFGILRPSAFVEMDLTP